MIDESKPHIMAQLTPDTRVRIQPEYDFATAHVWTDIPTYAQMTFVVDIQRLEHDSKKWVTYNVQTGSSTKQARVFVRSHTGALIPTTLMRSTFHLARNIRTQEIK